MIREAQRLGFPIRTGDQTMGHKGGGNNGEGWGVFVPQVGVEDHPSNRVSCFFFFFFFLL